MKKSDFIVTENYYIRLKEQTAKALIEKIKLNMNTKTTFKGRSISYQTILFSNAHGLAHLVIGKSQKLNFDIPSMAVKRNDNLYIQQRILSMTPDERRKQGINKSTLWYQKKHVAECKKIKVYEKVLAKYSS